MPGEDDVGDAPLAQDQIEIGRAERSFAGLVDDRLARARRELGDDVPARLAADQDAPAGAAVADADAFISGRPSRSPALVGGQVGEIGAVALARVQDRIAGRPHLFEHAADRIDAGARQADVITEQIDVTALAAEIGLHVDHDQRGVLRTEIAVPWPGVRIRRDEARDVVRHRHAPYRPPHVSRMFRRLLIVGNFARPASVWRCRRDRAPAFSRAAMQSFDAATLAQGVPGRNAHARRRRRRGVRAHRGPRRRRRLDRAGGARAAARTTRGAASSAARAGERLPLYGLPFAVKDNIDVAGPAHDRRLPRLRVPSRRATRRVVAQLIAAGALLIGKTNLDQFATGLVGVRSPYGIPRNPFDERYIVGRLQLGLGGQRRGRRWSASRWAPTRPARGACRRRSTTSWA